MTFLPTARCEVCGNFVEIHPLEPGGEDVWRLEAHDAAGGTIHFEQHNPDAAALVPRVCERCGEHSVSLTAAGADVQAVCSACGHRWTTGHLNQ